MGRHKTFDKEGVLTAVMGLFREQGFEATSLKDLERVSGLNPSSLYNSFGSKQALFIAALKHYNAQIVEGRIKTYLPKGCGFEGLKKLFYSVLSQPENNVKGCLLTNSAIEFAGQGQDINDVILVGFDALKVAFMRVLAEEQDNDDTEKSLLEQQAMQILVFYQGVLVMARFNPNNPVLPVLIDDFFTQFQYSLISKPNKKK